MAELSPVETLRAAARSARQDESLEFAYVLGPLAEPLAALFEFEAHQHETFGFAIGDRFLALARVLLGVPDGQ